MRVEKARYAYDLSHLLHGYFQTKTICNSLSSVAWRATWTVQMVVDITSFLTEAKRLSTASLGHTSENKIK